MSSEARNTAICALISKGPLNVLGSCIYKETTNSQLNRGPNIMLV